MNELPKPITELSAVLTSFPGIGPKMASRLAIFMATGGKPASTNLISAIQDVQSKVQVCQECGNLSEAASCPICSDNTRDAKMLMIIETATDLVQIEQTGAYSGYYVVLGRLISPINGIGPAELNLNNIFLRLESSKAQEVIIALSSTVEGEATALYLANLIKDKYPKTRVSRLARGLPTGVGIEYLDNETLRGALNGRYLLE